MRPIKLSLCAFGPFSGTEIIEFERLGENPLFLINGPTGSGKTTILDGICFALYGKTTGDEREAVQMRCDTAIPGLLTYVELVFRLGDKTWRIRREPEQLRPKGRGDGLTTHQPRAELYSRDDSGKESVLVASKVTEARLAIEELTGLNVEQFRQVMVLPQGEFRNLLMAKSSEREKVFSHLFQTQIYSRIEFALKAQAAILRKDLEASRNQQLGILQAANLESEEQLGIELASQAESLKESASVKAGASKQHRQAERDYLKAQEVAADFERLNQARAAYASLDQQSKEIKGLSEQLDYARVAIRIQPDFDQWQATVALRAQAELNLEKAQKKRDECWKQSKLDQYDLQQLVAREPQIEAIQQRKRELEAYRKRVGQYETALTTQEWEVRNQALSRKQRKASQSLLQTKQQCIDELRQQQQTVLERLKGLADSQIELHRLEGVSQQRLKAEAAEGKLDGCNRKLRELAAERIDAVQQRDLADKVLTRLELAWHTGQAVVLAAKLEPDQPCPVCGSQDHPRPASTKLEIPGDQERERAASRLVETNEALRVLDTNVSEQAVRKTHLDEIAEGFKLTLGEAFDQPVAEVLDARDRLHAQVQSLKSDEIKAQQHADRLQYLSSELPTLQDDLKAAERASTDADTRFEVAASRMRQAEAELPGEYRLSGTLEAQISALESEFLDYDKQKMAAAQAENESRSAHNRAEAGGDGARQQLKEAQQNQQAANKLWLKSVGGSRLKNQSFFQSSRLDDARMLKLEAQIKRHYADLDQTRGAVHSLEKLLSNEQEPDMLAIRRHADIANTELEAADAAYAEIDKRLSLLQGATHKLAVAKKQSQALEDDYAVVGTLADTASGKTGNRISLQRFVLSVLLDDVLTQASQRFSRMTRGRYTLYRQQEKGKGGGASGLELVVDDAYSGKQRPVATLSGGESFMAALSLALGLSDVVQAYAGGIKLDTLFIDEGFGSLDSESLELAVNTLIDLQSSGRMVGVISHVPELKERINVRLDVIADRSGSHTRMVLA